MTTNDSQDKFSADNLVYDGASKVIDKETAHLEAWRGRQPRVGLALSGGGIRSATYCLGVLQALAFKRALPQVDYLSTVSGGGYIGASLSYLLHQSASGPGSDDSTRLPKFDVSQENFPYVSYPMVSVAGRAAAPGTRQGPPPDSKKLRQNEKFKGRLVRRLRQSSNYLVPGDGITFLSLAGVVVRNLAASLVVHVALLVFLFQLFFWSQLFALNLQLETPAHNVSAPFGFPAGNAFLTMAGVALGAYAAFSLLYVLLTRFFDSMDRKKKMGPYNIRHGYEILTHWLFVFTLAMLVVGGLPWLHELLVRHNLMNPAQWLALLGPGDKTQPAAAGVVATVIGVIGNVWGFLQARSGKKPIIPTGLVVGVASTALAFGLLLLVFILTRWLNLNLASDVNAWILGTAGAVLILIGWMPEANYVSLHRFYRDRLLELFLPDLNVINHDMVNQTQRVPLHDYLWSRFQMLFAPAKGRATARAFKAQFNRAYARIGQSRPGDTAMLGHLCGVTLRKDIAETDATPAPGQAPRPEAPENKLLRGPYHIINANMVLVASQHPRYRPRGGDNFIFSPLFCGGRATGWVTTDRTPENGFTLATAMAISGAAVNPNAGPGGEGVTRQPVLSVLMGLLNLRLGYWVQNPKRAPGTHDRKPGSRWMRPNLLHPGLVESFGRFNLNEHARQLLLTDGGHFENLGLYELVRRRLKLIIVCDATADPKFKFADLANAIQKVRADFGALIDITAEQLATLAPQPQGDTKLDGAEPATALKGYLIVPIRYSMRLAQGDHSERDTGTLIILKATAFKGLPADLFSYRREHPEFPNQSTINQFFNEQQFDAYRELGYTTAFQMLSELHARLRVFPAMTETYTTKKGYQAQTDYTVANLLFG